jgi:hypothetical protein
VYKTAVEWRHKTIVPVVTMSPTDNNKVLANPASFNIQTEPIGSIPRPLDLIERVAKSDGGDPNLAPLYEAAIRDTLSGLKRRILRTVSFVTIEFALLVEIARAT